SDDYAEGSVEKASASGLDDFPQIHAESEGDDRGLQQNTRYALAFCAVGMLQAEPKNNSAHQRQRRRNHPNGGHNQAQEKDSLWVHQPLRLLKSKTFGAFRATLLRGGLLQFKHLYSGSARPESD